MSEYFAYIFALKTLEFCFDKLIDSLHDNMLVLTSLNIFFYYHLGPTILIEHF